MTPDLLALATDVDRLFRARQDGRQMPAGDVDPQKGMWVPQHNEAAAYRLAGLLDGYARDGQEDSVRYFWTARGDFQCFTNTRMLLRTRRHVAMLALTEPDHFKRCHDNMGHPVRGDFIDGKYVPVWRVRGVENHVAPEHREPDPKDTARTAAYLADLTERLRLYREAEAVRAENDAVAREAEARAEADAITDAGIEVDGDLLAGVA